MGTDGQYGRVEEWDMVYFAEEDLVAGKLAPNGPNPLDIGTRELSATTT
jgi:hypothetical protein